MRDVALFIITHVQTQSNLVGNFYVILPILMLPSDHFFHDIYMFMDGCSKYRLSSKHRLKHLIAPSLEHFNLDRIFCRERPSMSPYAMVFEHSSLASYYNYFLSLQTIIDIHKTGLIY
jgi:hypothetical protein